METISLYEANLIRLPDSEPFELDDVIYLSPSPDWGAQEFAGRFGDWESLIPETEENAATSKSSLVNRLHQAWIQRHWIDDPVPWFHYRADILSELRRYRVEDGDH